MILGELNCARMVTITVHTDWAMTKFLFEEAKYMIRRFCVVPIVCAAAYTSPAPPAASTPSSCVSSSGTLIVRVRNSLGLQVS